MVYIGITILLLVYMHAVWRWIRTDPALVASALQVGECARPLFRLTSRASDGGRYSDVRFLKEGELWNAAQNTTIGVMAILNAFIGPVIVSEAGNVASFCAAATIMNVGTAFGAVDMLKHSVVDVTIANAAALTSIAGIGFYSTYSSQLGQHDVIGWLTVGPVFVSFVCLLVYFGSGVDVFEINAEEMRDPQRCRNYSQLIVDLHPLSHGLRLLYVLLIAGISLYIGSIPLNYGCLHRTVAIHGHLWPQWLLAMTTFVSAILLLLFELMHLTHFLRSVK